MNSRFIRVNGLLFLLICFFISGNFLYSENNIFVERYSARAVGMGNVFTPIADDSTAVFYNPAGVGQFSFKTFFNFMYANVHNLGIFHNYIFSASAPFNDDIGMGGAWVYERIDLEPEIWGQHRFFYALSYKILEYLTVGSTVKLILINTDFKSYERVWGYGINAGLLASSEEWCLEFLDENNIILKIGLLVEDIHSSIKWDDNNTEKLPFRLALGFNPQYNQVINAALQFKGVNEDLTSFSVGIELFLLRAIDYQLDEMFKIDDIVLRAGFEREKIIFSGSSYSAGLGILAKKFRFDYAVLIRADYFSATHYFSINMYR